LGLPPLGISKALPSLFSDRVNLLAVCGLIGRQHSLQMASRSMTELTSKASRAGVSSSFRRLSNDGYLRVVKRSTFSTGNGWWLG
jgi:hypothetical protein